VNNYQNKIQHQISKPFLSIQRKKQQNPNRKLKTLFINRGKSCWNQIYLHACSAELAVTLDPQSISVMQDYQLYVIDDEAVREARRRRSNTRERKSSR
jgi:hypothetical protein